MGQPNPFSEEKTDSHEFKTAFARQYCFTLDAAIEQYPSGEAPGGFRVDLDYAKGSRKSVVIVDGATALTTSRRHLEQAELLSGSDWVFINSAGVASFDSRFTLAVSGKNEAGSRCLIEGRLRGRVDLRLARDAQGARILDANDEGPVVIRTWKEGLGKGSSVPLLVSVTFNVPIAGFSKAETELYKECEELSRNTFIGIGAAFYRHGKESPVSSIRLALYKLSDDLQESAFEPRKWNPGGPA